MLRMVPLEPECHTWQFIGETTVAACDGLASRFLHRDSPNVVREKRMLMVGGGGS